MLVKELPASYVGSDQRAHFMVPGWVTWAKVECASLAGIAGHVLILEDNRWYSNFPAECFMLYEPKLENVLKL
jgi:hypothetical protein